MKKFLIPVALFLSVETSFSQTSGYQFTTVVSNMSESYVRAKTISIMLHKDAPPKALRKKLGI